MGKSVALDKCLESPPEPGRKRLWGVQPRAARHGPMAGKMWDQYIIIYHNISVWPLQIVKKIDDLNIFKHLNHHMASRIAMKHPYGQWRFHIWKKRVGGVPAKPGNRRTEVSVEQWYILGQGMAGHPVAEAEAETKLHWCLNWSGNPQMMADFTETQASHMPHEHWSSFHKHA